VECPSFDFERSTVLSNIQHSSDLEDYYIVSNYAWGPSLVPKKNVRRAVISELSSHTGMILVDITGRGSHTYAVVAADAEWKLINWFKSRGLQYSQENE